MSQTTVGVIGIAGLFVLLALRMPVAIALIAVGLIGIAVLGGWGAALATLSAEIFEFASTYNLMVIPLFVLMGNLASVSGMSRDLYGAAYAWVGHWRGGLASATIVGCSGFAALSGSSVASAVTMGRVALPEMRRYNYSPKLATGAIAAGGTLGILIPPSTGFVIYAILTEASIGKLFLAGVLPGLLLTGLFMTSIFIQTRLRPELGPPGPVVPAAEKLRALGRASAIVAIVLITIGGIYGGAFTPVEAAGVGAVLALGVALARRSITRASAETVLLQTVRTTAMSFLIIIGAHIFSPFLARSDIPRELAGLLAGLDIGAVGVLAVVLVAFILLGTFLEGFAILVLSVPIVLPIVQAAGVPELLGFARDTSDLVIWFGVVMVVVLEMGLISPPVGVNVFVVKSIAEDVPLKDIFAGILPFWIAMGVCLVLLVVFPDIALTLPRTMIESGGG